MLSSSSSCSTRPFKMNQQQHFNKFMNVIFDERQRVKIQKKSFFLKKFAVLLYDDDEFVTVVLAHRWMDGLFIYLLRWKMTMNKS